MSEATFVIDRAKVRELAAYITPRQPDEPAHLYERRVINTAQQLLARGVHTAPRRRRRGLAARLQLRLLCVRFSCSFRLGG